MLRHVATFARNETATPEDVDRFEAMLAGLPDQIPEIRAYRFGRDLGLKDGNLDYAVTADFDDEAGWRVYQDHPAHRAVIEFLTPRVRQRIGVQFHLD